MTTRFPLLHSGLRRLSEHCTQLCFRWRGHCLRCLLCRNKRAVRLPVFLIHMPPYRAFMHSSFFMLSSIASAIISPPKQSIIGAIYSFPSLHGLCVMSVSHFLLDTSALKSPFKRFSGRSAFLSDLVSSSGLLLLLCRRTSLKPCRILEMSYEFEV